MLTQALGTTEVISVLTKVQILTFTTFITFYIPCVATMAVLARELDRKWMFIISGITLSIALVISLLVRFFGGFFI